MFLFEMHEMVDSFVPMRIMNSQTEKGAAPPKEVPKKVVTPKKKAPVPESLQKTRLRAEKWTADAAKARVELKKKRKASRRDAFNKARKYETEYRKTERRTIALRRVAKDGGSFFVEAEPKVALVVRIRGINGVSPRVKKCLQLLRLRHVHAATFVRLNHASLQMLKLVEPYVTYGAPNLKTVRELVYKRGFAKVNKQRVPITHNSIIEEKLGKHGVTCMEDIIHEIFTCGPRFKEVNRFLWPFKLSSPKGGFVKKRINFTEGGDAGDREHHINGLARRMN